MSLRTLTHYTSLNEEFNIPTQSRPKVLTREEVECAVGMLNASLREEAKITKVIFKSLSAIRLV